MSNPEISLAKTEAYCCHITAHPSDEYRIKFPLTESDAPNGVDLTLYGSHSDIGGGYANRKYEPIVDNDSLDPRIKFSTKLKNLQIEFSKLFAIKFWNGKFIHHYNQIKIIEKGNARGYKKLELIDTRFINNDIQKVSCLAMINIAEKIGIKFDKNIEENNIDLNIKESDKSLYAYNELIKNLIAKTNKVNEPILAKLDSEFYFNLYHDYIHISANYEAFGFLSLKIFVNEPTKDRKRETLPHKRAKNNEKK